MGRGDKKTKKGKIAIGSFGNSRKRKAIKVRLQKANAPRKQEEPVSAEVAVKPKRASKKKSEA